jgi:hypothetical protein
MTRTASCVCIPGENPFGRRRLGRRQTLQATGIGFIATLSAILLGAGRPPTVDGLSVRILADNRTDRYSVPLATPRMKVDRTGGSEQPGVAPVATWRDEWGLSSPPTAQANASTTSPGPKCLAGSSRQA